MLANDASINSAIDFVSVKLYLRRWLPKPTIVIQECIVVTLDSIVAVRRLTTFWGGKLAPLPPGADNLR